MHAEWLYYLLLGLGVSQSILVIFTLADSPPDPLGWAVRTIAGGLGGILGAWCTHLSMYDPATGIVALGALAGATLLVGVARVFGGPSSVKP
jgi:uncharacterized membrane protein HdeD (DUF308 family)